MKWYKHEAKIASARSVFAANVRQRMTELNMPEDARAAKVVLHAHPYLPNCPTG